jgi:cytochrome c553
MFKKSTLSFVLFTAILMIMTGILLRAQSAQASVETFAESGVSSCLTCHENRYYQHDTGNHYCLTDAASRCVDCHAGNPEAFEEKAAHAGLIVYPILNGDISRCESCHAEGAQSHVDTFAKLAGFSANVIVAEQVQPSASSHAAGTQAKNQGLLNGKVVVGLTVLLTVIAGLFTFCILINRSCQ